MDESDNSIPFPKEQTDENISPHDGLGGFISGGGDPDQLYGSSRGIGDV